ncbi:MAG TPA: BTAD domain-containing putative transcriptional regulator [Thermoanaerobaculia bacterium]
MSEPAQFPPSDRLLSRITALDSPLVQLWGWPGSGRTAVLEALLARHGRQALGLPLAAVTSEAVLREALEAAREVGVRWLVASGRPDRDRVAEAGRWLLPGQRLVLATDLRPGPAALSQGIVPPQDMLLDRDEIAGLWRLLVGGDLSPQAAESLKAATDGWYRPLRLALESTGGLGLEKAGPEAILEIPAVRTFLRHEVLDTFSSDERDLLLDAPDARPAAGGTGEEAWELLEDRGLWIEGPERDCLPRLLAAALERERRRRRPPRGLAATGVLAGGQPVAASTVYILGLLGSPVARQRDEDGERDLDWRLRRSFQVLAFLASSPGLQAGREEVIEAVWPTEGERTIERNFHPTLSHLRRALEGGSRGKDRPAPLLFRNGVYKLNPEVGWEIDILELNRLADEGKELAARGESEPAAEAWQRAWKLYRGPFLQGYYEGWVTLRREQYQRRYLELLRDLGNLYVALGRNEEAMDAFRSYLIEDPFQESIHVEVMRLYARQGRRDLVRRQYDQLCRILLEDLSQAPLAETAKEYHDLMG